jgi:hypothetical protein
MSKKLGQIAKELCDIFQIKRSITSISFIELIVVSGTDGLFEDFIHTELTYDNGISLKAGDIEISVESETPVDEIVRVFVDALMENEIFKQKFRQASIGNRSKKLESLIK